MASKKESRWIYAKEELEATPSRKDRIDADKELSYRQQAANLIQDMGQRLSVNQLTINTAIVYMHRFYVYHSFSVFSRYAIAPTALFVAAKVEEQPKKLEHVLKICHACLHPEKAHLDVHSEAYLKQAQELVQNELVLLQTLGFDISVDHPHTHVVKCTQLVKASRDLSQMAYFMATNSLHLTTFCLLFKPTVVAAMCIHLSCKWSNYEIPLSSDGKPYWAYMDSCITEPLLDTIINDFLKILNRCPTRLRKLKNYRPSLTGGKDGNESKNDNLSVPSQPQKPSAPVQPQSEKPIQPPQPVKEKKPSMSYEEYKNKRTHATKAPPPPPNPKSQLPPPSNHKSSHPVHHHHHLQHGQIKKLENHGPTSQPQSSSRPNRTLPPRPPHPKEQSEAHLPKPPPPPPQWKVPSEAHQSKRPVHQESSQKNMMKPPDQQLIKGERTRPSHEQHSNSKLRPHAAPTNHTSIKSESEEELALNRALEGRINSEKLIQQRAEASHSKPRQPSSVAASQAIVDKSRHHASKPRVDVDGKTVDTKVRRFDSKQMVEMYKKAPDKLRHYLKYNAQTAEEKALLAKLQAKEEERKKRKAAEAHKLSKPHVEKPIARVESPGGALKLKIKLGPKPGSAETGSSSSVTNIVATNSGSDQQQSPARSRKRAHGEDASGHTASKHSKRSDGHHRHSHSGNKQLKHHSKTHSRSSSKPSEPIDEAMFQKSLSDALSKVQQASGIATVTLKRSSNGKDSNYFTASLPRKRDFDPSITAPTQMPDDLFEEEAEGGENESGSKSHSQESTPEPGEIKDESPPYPKSVSKSRPAQKAPGLFSPPNDQDSQLVRSSSGYHSAQDTDFSPPVLYSQKHFVK